MAEYIEREAAAKLLRKEATAGSPTAYHIGLYAAVRAIEALPAADVRPVVKAHWYWDKDGMDWGIGSWRCSACHSRPETWWQGDSGSPRNKSGRYFCPNCGADMREES